MEDHDRPRLLVHPEKTHASATIRRKCCDRQSRALPADEIWRFLTKIVQFRGRCEVLRTGLTFTIREILFRRRARGDSFGVTPVKKSEKTAEQLIHRPPEIAVEEGSHPLLVRHGRPGLYGV